MTAPDLPPAEITPRLADEIVATVAERIAADHPDSEDADDVQP